MASQTYSVSLTTGLIEKLAGIKKPEQPKGPAKAITPLPSRPILHPEVAALAREDAQLSRALQSSTRVGNLLLKQEEEESKKISQLTDELLKKYSFSPKSTPCKAERDACLSCYQQNPNDPLKCSQVVSAYSRCADQAFSRTALQQ